MMRYVLGDIPVFDRAVCRGGGEVIGIDDRQARDHVIMALEHSNGLLQLTCHTSHSNRLQATI